MNVIDTKRAYQSGQIPKPEYIDRMFSFHQGLFAYAELLQSTDVARIEIADGTVIVTMRESGIRLLCDPNDKRMVPLETLNFDHYERHETGWMLRLVQDGDTILDIGANIGWYSLLLSKHFPRCRIHAFEPIPKTFGYLEKHVALNHVTNASIYNSGFSDREDSLTFYFYPEGSGNAAAANHTQGATVQEIPCRVRRLDDFVRENSLRVDFMKVDVEGAELLVFQGGSETIRTQTPVIFTEMLRKWSANFHYHPNEIIALLAGWGYRCFTVRSDRLQEFFTMDEQTEDTNFFFLHGTAHAERIGRLAR